MDEETVTDCWVPHEDEDDERTARDAEGRDLRERDGDVGTIWRVNTKKTMWKRVPSILDATVTTALRSEMSLSINSCQPNKRPSDWQ